MAVSLQAPAKLNVGLRVLARRPDGYHEIETLFVPLDLSDVLLLERSPTPGINLIVEGADLPRGAENLAVQAAEALYRALGRSPALRIRLEKRIPVAAGLGGGSSDAAATLRGIEELEQTQLPPVERLALARRLGADVPFFLDPRPALGRGVGEVLTPLEGIPALWWVLVTLPFHVSTAKVYQAASAELTLPRQGSSIAALLGPSGVTARPINDLEGVTRRWHPEVGLAQQALSELGARVTGMSGSGPTVYGQFASRAQAEQAAARAADRLPIGRALVASSPASAR